MTNYFHLCVGSPKKKPGEKPLKPGLLATKHELRTGKARQCKSKIPRNRLQQCVPHILGTKTFTLPNVAVTSERFTTLKQN